MIITVEHSDGRIEHVDSEKWRTYSAAIGWDNLTDAIIRFDGSEFTVNLVNDGREHCVTINGNSRYLPSNQIIPSIRLALSCAILRGRPFNGFVRPM